MLVHMLYDWPEWLLFAIFLASMFLGAEAGFWLGRIAPKDPAENKEASMVTTSMLAVLGLLLGFSMSMAVSRFEMRKLLVVQESNALGTSWLRTQLLPEPVRTEVSNSLRVYVDARIRGGGVGEDLTRLNYAHEEALRLQSEFWERTVAYSRMDPNPVTSGLLLQSLNESIDLAAARWVAIFNHVPESVFLVDALIAVLSAVLLGYQPGIDGQRRRFTTSVLAMTIALIWISVIDMDRPHHGFIQIGQEPMLELRRQIGGPLN